jgi:hypothetical protein
MFKRLPLCDLVGNSPRWLRRRQLCASLKPAGFFFHCVRSPKVFRITTFDCDRAHVPREALHFAQ